MMTPPEAPSMRERVIHHGASLVLILLIFGAALAWALREPAKDPSLTAPSAEGAGAAEARALLEDNQLRRIQRAVEVYTLAHGKPPASLDELVAHKLLDALDLGIPYGRVTRYGLKQGTGEVTILPRDAAPASGSP